MIKADKGVLKLASKIGYSRRNGAVEVERGDV